MRVFYVASPRHFTLSCAIAAKHKQPSTLIISGAFNSAETIYAFCQKQKNLASLFNTVFFPEKFTYRKYAFLKRKLNNVCLIYRQKSIIRQIFSQGYITELITAMPNNWATQYAMHIYKKNQKSDLNVSYLEDGLFSYIDKKAKKISPIKKAIEKIKIGTWYQTPQTTGASDWVKKSYFLHANLASHAIQKNPIVSIDPDWLRNKILTKIINDICALFNIRKDAIQNITYFFILDVCKPNSKRVTELNACITKIINNGGGGDDSHKTSSA